MDKEVTETVFNCQPIPQHPSTTTSRKVVAILEVLDAVDGTRCTAGLPRDALSVLMHGEMILTSMYRYAALNGHLYCTRPNGVILVVSCTDADDAQPATPAETVP